MPSSLSQPLRAFVAGSPCTGSLRAEPREARLADSTTAAAIRGEARRGEARPDLTIEDGPRALFRPRCRRPSCRHGTRRCAGCCRSAISKSGASPRPDEGEVLHHRSLGRRRPMARSRRRSSGRRRGERVLLSRQEPGHPARGLRAEMDWRPSCLSGYPERTGVFIPHQPSSNSFRC